MRLLTLDFLNVNSLAGHWHIDFTVPDYRTSPLFAITGSTGSGKSSVLDAVSLALYGETPRAQNTDEKKKDADAEERGKDRYDESCPMLTKGTRKISASVRFIAGGHIYGSTWSRYVKRTGKLSEVLVELIEFSSESDTEGRVLTTKKKEWDKLIVEVTKMNFKTFTRSVLLAQGAFSNFLRASEHDRAEILEDITGTDIYSKIGVGVWERCKAENQKIGYMQTDLKHLTPLPADEREALETEAAAVTGAHAKAKTTLDTLTGALNWRRQTDKAQMTVVEKVKALADADRELKAYEPDALRAQKARAALEPIRLHRESEYLGREIHEIDRKRQDITERLRTLEAGRESRQTAVTKTAADFDAAREAREAFAVPYREMIEADTAVAGLVAQQKRQTDTLARAEAKLVKTDNAARAALEAEALARRQADADQTQFEANREDDAIEPKLNGLTASVAIINEKTRTASQLRRQTGDAEMRVAALQKSAADALTREKAELATAEALRTAQTEALRRYETAKGAERPETAFEAVADLTARMAAAGEAARLMEDRRLFAAGMEESLATLQTDARLKTFLDSMLGRMDAHLRAIDTQEPGLLSQLASGLTGYVERLKAERHAIVEHTAEVSVLRSAAEKADRLAREAERTAEKAESVRLTAEAALTREKENLAVCRTNLEATVAALAKARTDFDALLTSLPASPADGDPEAILIALTDRVRARRAFLEGMQKTLDRLQDAKEAAALLRRDSENARTAAADAKTELADTEARLTQRQTDRRKRFGDTDPNREAARLTETFNRAQKEAALAEDNARKAREESDRLTLLGNTLSEERTKQAEQMRKRLAERDEGMVKGAFPDLDSLLAAELTLSAIEAIEREARRRADKAALLSGQSTQAEETLAKLKAMKLSDEDAETLALKQADAETLFLQLTQKGAQLKEKLTIDDEKRTANVKAMKALDAQKAIAAQWDRLSALIGSARGQNFRAAAQKITFRILLQYANEAMRTMTGRYWLHAAGEGGLSVDVVDNDMGGQIRTSKNLSGGECFMVSLALALGLSRMGGKNLRVDTLFLDEGFGTLDETTLNNALYALENLQASSGKLIGIISHVKSVKERIQNHITVTQRAGSGLSTLQGPGVTRLADE